MELSCNLDSQTINIAPAHEHNPTKWLFVIQNYNCLHLQWEMSPDLTFLFLYQNTDYLEGKIWKTIFSIFLIKILSNNSYHDSGGITVWYLLFYFYRELLPSLVRHYWGPWRRLITRCPAAVDSSGVGATRIVFTDLSDGDISSLKVYITSVEWITFIFDRCFCSPAAETPVKYECFDHLKSGKKIATGENWFSALTPGRLQHPGWSLTSTPWTNNIPNADVISECWFYGRKSPDSDLIIFPDEEEFHVSIDFDLALGHYLSSNDLVSECMGNTYPLYSLPHQDLIFENLFSNGS